MPDVVARLINRPLTADGPITRLFRAAGARFSRGYEMSEGNTPGVGRVLSAHGLSYIPEAHCYLRCQGERVDMTGVPAGATPIERFLHEEPTTVDQIGAYKNDLHRRFLRDWIARTEPLRGRSLDDVWRIREACIAALGGGVYATPAR